MEVKSGSKEIAKILQLTTALRTSLAGGDSPNCGEYASSLVESLSVQAVEDTFTNYRRRQILSICRPALELLAKADLLREEDLLVAFTKHEIHAVETPQVEAEVFSNAISALQHYYSLDSREYTVPTAIMAKVGNLFHQAFQLDPAESEGQKACNLFLQAFISNSTNIDAAEGLCQLVFSTSEIFGFFDKEIFQELSQQIRSILGLNETSHSSSEAPIDATTRHRYCRALLDLLCAQRRAFETLLGLDDICSVIEGLKQLLLIVPEDGKWLYKAHLSTSLRLRFRLTENREDGDEALALAIEAWDAAPRTPQARAACFEAHAKAVTVLYEFFETESLLDEMVELFAETLSAHLENSEQPRLLPLALLDLASAVCFRYAKLGGSDDMEIARSSAEQALRCFPTNDKQYDLRRSLCLQKLGDIHLRLHWRSSGLEHLDKAMTYYKECEEQNDYPSVLSLYGSTQYNYALIQKGYRRHDTTYTTLAFKRKTEWLAAHSGEDFHLSPIDNINNALVPGQAMPFVARQMPTVEERDQLIDAAIDTLQVAMGQKSIAARFVYVFEALAIALLEKAAYSRQLADYEKSLQHFRKSSEVFTEDQLTNHLRIKLQFADVLYMAAEIGSTDQYAEEGLRVLTPIIEDSRLSAWVRVRAAVSAARFHYNLSGDAKAASLALLKAHELMPHATAGMSRSDQLQLLEEEFDIPAWTLVLSLARSTPQTSLELLERGRGIFWNGILSKKSVYSSGSEAVGPESVYRTLRRLSIGSEFGQALQIRPEDLFRDTQDLKVIPEEDGQDGPVVFINVHALRSDALILTNNKVHMLELPGLKEADCVSYYHQLVSVQSMLVDESSKLLASETLSEICKWLWETAARDILGVLGFHDRLPEDLVSSPRIWWVTTKWISVLPIHAAGDYSASEETREPNSVCERVVSSYVPTIKVLRLLRRRLQYFKSLSPDNEATALLVAMPTTPSFPDLPCARVEIEFVKTSVGPVLRIQELIHPTSQIVIDILKECALAHFACHTKIDGRDPSKSQLLLMDWSSHETLSVDRLLDMELPKCRIVYLSSCNSARDWVARETSMHIATGFLMAGVPNVIGTMWKVQDKTSAEVATEFYRNLHLDDSMNNFSSAAIKLHKTIRRLKESGMNLVDWAPYVHFGS
jgi:tetratricopeptide (TPR) repeat protein